MPKAKNTRWHFSRILLASFFIQGQSQETWSAREKVRKVHYHLNCQSSCQPRTVSEARKGFVVKHDKVFNVVWNSMSHQSWSVLSKAMLVLHCWHSPKGHLLTETLSACNAHITDNWLQGGYLRTMTRNTNNTHQHISETFLLTIDRCSSCLWGQTSFLQTVFHMTNRFWWSFSHAYSRITGDTEPAGNTDRQTFSPLPFGPRWRSFWRHDLKRVWHLTVFKEAESSCYCIITQLWD